MSSSTLRVIPFEYNEEIRKLDEQIISLIQARRETAGGKTLRPDHEMIKTWEEQFGFSSAMLYQCVNLLDGPLRQISQRAEQRGELVSVIPLMQKVISGNFTYQLTHLMKYENVIDLYAITVLLNQRRN